MLTLQCSEDEVLDHGLQAQRGLDFDAGLGPGRVFLDDLRELVLECLFLACELLVLSVDDLFGQGIFEGFSEVVRERLFGVVVR